MFKISSYPNPCYPWRRPLGWLVAGVVAVLVREVTRSPGSQQWPVQECLAPLQPPVLHSLLLEAGSDKATHHG